MKKTILVLSCLLLISVTAFCQYTPTKENLQARKTFEGFRFGIFLHWGIYSEFAQGEWYLNSGKLQQEEYQKAASCFYPIRFNADEWVKAIKDSGAKYITFTSRHHDGFSMWQTKESNYNIVDATPFKRDVIKELSEACQKEDIRLHLYYSILDWIREDYPLGRTGHDTGRTLRPDYESYFQFMKNQVRELLCNYKGIEGIWLDGYWDHDADSIPFNWRMEEFYQYIHTLKPTCLIGNNHHISPIEGEDFQMFERDLPGENKAGLSGQDISALPLEMCQTMNGMWGYKVADQDYKSTRELISLLVRAASKGSNLLLNIGPQPNGELPRAALDRLKGIGEWMKVHGETIYNTTKGEEYPWGVTTRKGLTIYAHVLEPTETISIPLAKEPMSVSVPYNYDSQQHLLTIPDVKQYDIIEIQTASNSRRVVFKTEPTGIPYRIPALAKCQNGDLIAIADYRYCKSDIGYGAIDIRYRTSHDNGDSWNEERVLADGNDQLTGNDWRYAFGDACVVADRESPNVVMFCVGGHVGFFQSGSDNPQHVVRFRSSDNGKTWDAGTCITEQIYGLYRQRNIGSPKAIFLTSGRILQSSQIKTGNYHRLYIAHPIRDGGVGVIFSDDFGETWQVLGNPEILPSGACDESVLEELPDGSVLLSVRTPGKRMINVFRYSDPSSATGHWDTEAAAKGITDVNACNGELLIVPAIRKADGRQVHIVLHSLPQSNERINVGFYYKEICSNDDYATSDAAAAHWEQGLQVSSTSSCYSTMLQLDDGSIALLYEENGQNGGYDIIFQKFSLEEITNDAYSTPLTQAQTLFGDSYDKTPTLFGDSYDKMPQPVDYVSTLVGTESKFSLSTGNTYPAIAMPWGMNFWVAQTGKMGDGWQYTYNADKIRGFKQTHQPSPWINDYGQFSLMPTVGERVFDETRRASWFSHKAETARPYYYQVYLADYDVLTELAPTERAAIFRFTFPETDQAHVVIDAFDKGSYVKVIPEKQTVIGYTTRNSGGVPDNFKNYFVIQFDHPFTDFATVQDSVFSSAQEMKAAHAGAVVSFKTRRGEIVCARVASSFISPEQAEQNLKEIGESSFEHVMQKGRDCWNKVLGRIEIEDDNPDHLRTFYSCLYRSVLFPRSFYEITAEGETVHYSPYNGEVRKGYMFTDTGFWDTFRCLFPLLNLVYPSMNREMQEGLVNTYLESGFLPEWASPGHRGCMVGNNSASIVADAYLKGLRNYDIETLWKAVIHGTEAVHPSVSSTGRIGYEYYNKLGYVPYDVKISENAARTLEYAYDDWCIYQLGKALGKSGKVINVFAQRAKNYQNLFDPETRLMRGKLQDGTFMKPFNPLKWGDAFTEGNSWHYTWSVFHDPQGLINLMGGKTVFNQMLDSVFALPPVFDDSYYGFPIHEIREMQIMNMGNYAHGNQPIQHMIYLYGYSGQPWKSQYWIRQVMDRLYTPYPDGYCGDEDNGQTSAWYVFSALGFYPVCPGSNQYVLGTPYFQKAVIHLENGQNIRIQSQGEGCYIQRMTLNDSDYQHNYLEHDTLLKGARINYVLDRTPNQQRGTADDDAPYSFSNQK